MTKTLCYVLASCIALLFWLAPRPTAAQAQQQATLVIDGGTLIDGSGGAPVPNALIIIQGNRITNVSRKGQISYPSTAQVIHSAGLLGSRNRVRLVRRGVGAHTWSNVHL